MITKKANKVLYVPDTVICPGETLLEILEEREMTQVEFAKRIGRPIKTVNEIIKGKAPISPETAFRFEQVLGISAGFWNSLEANHREMLVRMKSEEEYKDLIEEAKVYPYKKMVRNGWVKDAKNQVQRVKNLLSFFGTTSFENIIEKRAFRISTKQKYSLPAITAWLRRGSIEAMDIETREFDSRKLKDSLEILKSLTNINNPNELMPQIGQILADCGVVFVVTKNLPNAPINGSTRWLSPSKALIQMSIRNAYSDIFWFSLFHEIGHILLGSKKDFSVDLRNGKCEEKTEKKVDKFAQEILIPPEPYKIFLSFAKKRGSYRNIYSACEKFAHEIDVHPGIIVGRLQRDGVLRPNMNKLRVRFKWV